MDREEVTSVTGPVTPLFAPFPLLLTGMTLVAAAWLMGAALEGSLPVLRAVLLFTGVIAAGGAVAAHLAHARYDVEGRLGSAVTWLLAAATLFVARWALDPAWDSIGFLFGVLMVVSGAAAVVIILPRAMRQVVISLLILFHFGAVLNAVVVRPPRGGDPPWLALQTWMRVYRPYLMFTRLDDPYHFLAPEPSPCTVLWFRVTFADGTAKWVRLPDMAACRNQVERSRLAALAAAVGQAVPMPPPRSAEEKLFQDKRQERRLEAGKKYDPPIPAADTLPLIEQYREPTIEAKMLLASYVRYVARTTEHPNGQAVSVSAVKVYRVEFREPPIEHFQAGRELLDPELYQAWYQGEYGPDGRLVEKVELVRNARGEPIGAIQDPFLYWLIPIVRVSDDPGAKRAVLPGLPAGARRTEDLEIRPWTGGGKIVNFVRIHAGDRDEQESVP
jgi:hypothetical protein